MANLEKEKLAYDKILVLHDRVDQMLDAIEAPGLKNPQEILSIVQPVIEQVEESAEKVSNILLEFAENGSKPNKKLSDDFDTAMRKIYTALYKFKADAEKIADKLEGKN